MNSIIQTHFSKSAFPVCLAPMVGLSHVALRMLLREYMPVGSETFWPTEMLNSRRLPFENLQTTAETLRDPSETYLVPQILGNEEKAIAASVLRLENEWGAAGIDINMGCPVQKALRHNYGVALMGDAKYAAEVVRMTVRNTGLPVSVKLRALASPGAVTSDMKLRSDATFQPGVECEDGQGPIQDNSFLMDFIGGLQSAGAAWITLHPRTAEQKRRGSADWSQILQIKKQINIPVVGNGDVQTSADVFQMLQDTGCDKVMVGRALAARPWLLWQVGESLGLPPPVVCGGGVVGLNALPRAALRAPRAPQTPEEEGQEYGRCLLRLIDLCEYYFVKVLGLPHEDLALRKLRFYVRMTSPWLDFGQSVIGVCHKSQSLQQMRDGVFQLFQNPICMYPKTELRQ
ncbi:MAG: tRNA-dihydrouridine synthase family protein [Pseudobdellovibrionaceae bacterium]